MFSYTICVEYNTLLLIFLNYVERDNQNIDTAS